MENNNGSAPERNKLGLTEEQMAESTIFSAPKAVSRKELEKAPKKQNFILRIILAPIIIIALILGVLLLNKYFRVKQSSSSASSSQVDKSTVITMTDHKADDIKSVEIINDFGKLQFYSKKIDNLEDREKNWFIKGIKEEYIEPEMTYLTVGDCGALVALMKRDYSESIDYGFDKPEAKAEVVLESGETYTITIGKPFIKGEMKGAYALLSTDSDSVYVLDSEAAEYFSRNEAYYINPFAPTMIEKTKKNAEYFGDNLDAFDYIEFGGKDVQESYRFEMYGRENSSIKYKMVSPEVRLIDGEKLVNVLSIISEDLECGGIYEYESGGLSDKTLEKYGLNSPDATMEYKVGEDIIKIKLKQSKTDEMYYAMTVNDAPIIYMVTKLSFDFFEYKPSGFASSAVILDDIAGVEAAEFIIGGRKYTFDLKTKKETDDGNEDLLLSVKYDGKTIDAANFKRYYYYMLAISPYISDSSLLNERPEGAKEYLKVTLKHNSKTADEDLVLEIFELKDHPSRYYIELDSVPVGLCQTRFCDLLVSSIDEVISNKEIADIS